MLSKMRRRLFTLLDSAAERLCPDDVPSRRDLELMVEGLGIRPSAVMRTAELDLVPYIEQRDAYADSLPSSPARADAEYQIQQVRVRMATRLLGPDLGGRWRSSQLSGLAQWESVCNDRVDREIGDA